MPTYIVNLWYNIKDYFSKLVKGSTGLIFVVYFMFQEATGTAALVSDLSLSGVNLQQFFFKSQNYSQNTFLQNTIAN